jgi:hypothetical protein
MQSTTPSMTRSDVVTFSEGEVAEDDQEDVEVALELLLGEYQVLDGLLEVHEVGSSDE